MKYFSISSLIIFTLFFAACSSSEEATQQPHEEFFEALSAHCGEAFPGGLTLEPPGDDMLEGEELLVVHFRECGDDVIKIPFHIQKMDGTWDRSRTWVITKHEDGLELRHDHRNPDGTEDDVTMYGGFQVDAGSAESQKFQSTQRTEESGYFRGWRIEMVPGERYTYGTMRRDDWSWRIDFDLTEAMETPPAPWGHK